jgi:hypothetical protein
LFIAKPQARDVCRAKPENIFERAAYFAELEVYAEALEQFDKQASAFRENRLGSDFRAVEPVIGDHIDGRRTGAVAHNVEKSARRERWR